MFEILNQENLLWILELLLFSQWPLMFLSMDIFIILSSNGILNELLANLSGTYYIFEMDVKHSYQCLENSKSFPNVFKSHYLWSVPGRAHFLFSFVLLLNSSEEWKAMPHCVTAYRYEISYHSKPHKCTSQNLNADSISNRF